MRAGKLRHRITIKQRTLAAADAYGYQEPSLSAFATLWASVEPISGREFDFAKSFAASVSHKMTMRHYPGITSLMLVSFKSRAFAINAVLNPEERNRETVLMCTEIVNPMVNDGS